MSLNPVCTRTFVTPEVHVKVVRVGPLQPREHLDVLLGDLGVLLVVLLVFPTLLAAVLLGLLLALGGLSLLDLVDGGPEVPHVDEAVEGALGDDRPLGGDGEGVDDRVLALVALRLGHDEVDHAGPVKRLIEK